MGRLQYRGPAGLLVAMLAGALLAAPIAVLASHQFTDVPPGHPFHKEIGAVADAGIAQGFSDGTYKPGANVTRQAMAAFLERAVGRTAYDQGVQVLGMENSIDRAVLSSVSIDPGAQGAGSRGFVLLNASFEISTDDLYQCPCVVGLELRVNNSLITETYVQAPTEHSMEHGVSVVGGALHAVVPINGNEPASYQLAAKLQNEEVFRLFASGWLTALYVPLGPDGDDTLAYEHTCAVSETEPNNTRATATSFGTGGCRFGRFTDVDLDHFSLSIAAGQTLTIETRTVDGVGCDGDTVVELMNANGTVIATDDDSGIVTCSRLVLSGLAAGTYYALVRPYLNAGEQPAFDYRVTATQTPAAAGHDPSSDLDDIAKD